MNYRIILIGVIALCISGLLASNSCNVVTPKPAPAPVPTPPPAPAPMPTSAPAVTYEEVLYTMRGSSQYYSWVTYGGHLNTGDNLRAVVQLTGNSSEYETWICDVINPEGAVCEGDFDTDLGQSIGLDFYAKESGYYYIFVQHYATLDRNLSLKIPSDWKQTGYGYSKDEFYTWLHQYFPAQYPAVPSPAPAPAPVPSPTPSTLAPTLTPELPLADFELTAYELISAYDKSPDMANAQYRGKAIRVTGYVVGDWDESHKINPYTVVLLITNTPGNLFGISCMFDIEYEPVLMQFRSGDFVTVQGTVTGYEADVLMRDCVLVR
jgi:hypothetical protein